MDITAYIDPKLLYVVAACWVFGFALKRTPRVPDWSIIWFVTGLSIVLTGCILGFSAESVIQGILAGAAAVYGHQLYKQSTNRDSSK